MYKEPLIIFLKLLTLELCCRDWVTLSLSKVLLRTNVEGFMSFRRRSSWSLSSRSGSESEESVINYLRSGAGRGVGIAIGRRKTVPAGAIALARKLLRLSGFGAGAGEGTGEEAPT